MASQRGRPPLLGCGLDLQSSPGPRRKAEKEMSEATVTEGFGLGFFQRNVFNINHPLNQSTLIMWFSFVATLKNQVMKVVSFGLPVLLAIM